MLTGHIAVGHARYSTTGSNKSCNAGPMIADSSIGKIAVSHNGNLVNASSLRDELELQGEHFESTTDSEILTRLIALSPGDTIVDMRRSGKT
jgi:amidophosphoribosyltransferase